MARMARMGTRDDFLSVNPRNPWFNSFGCGWLDRDFRSHHLLQVVGGQLVALGTRLFSTRRAGVFRSLRRSAERRFEGFSPRQAGLFAQGFASMKVKQATRPPGKEPGWQTVCVCVFLVAAVWAVFGQTAGFGFVNLDDNVYVFENPKVASGLSLEGIAYAFTHAECHLYHPLTMISLRLDYQLHGLHAGGYHLTNVLIHTASVILLFLILRRMTGALWRSAFVAAVFAIHPLRVESVAWVTERKDVLGTFFFMLTLWAYVRHAEKCVIHYSLFTIHYSLALFFFVLGLLSKPIAVTLPFVLLLLDYWPLNRFTPWRPTGAFGIPRRLILEKVPLMALAAAACVVTYDTAEKAVMTAAQFPCPCGSAMPWFLTWSICARRFGLQDWQFFIPCLRKAFPFGKWPWRSCCWRSLLDGLWQPGGRAHGF